MNWVYLLIIACIGTLWALRRFLPFSYRDRHRLAIVAVAYLIFSPFMLYGEAQGRDHYVRYFAIGLALWLFVSIATGGAERDANGRLLPEFRRKGNDHEGG